MRWREACRVVVLAVVGVLAGVSLVVVFAGVSLVVVFAGVPVALGASPTPSAAPVGDPRSSGAGPGLVGDPLLAIGGVALIAVLSLLATLAYVRATGGPRRS